MKRNMLTVLIVIVGAGLLGTLIQRDPGYVLVTYDGSSLQTSLWVAIGLLTALVFGLYYGARFVRFLLNTTGYVSAWNQQRQQNRAIELVSRGILCFLEGDYARARRFLENGATHHRFPAASLLLAAECSDRQGDSEAREKFLRMATEADPGAKAAAAVTIARLAASHDDWQTCLTALDDAPKNEVSADLKRDALLARDEADEIRAALPMLKKSGNADEAEKRLAMSSLDSPAAEDARKAYKALSAGMKQDTEVVLRYCQVVGEKEAENALRVALANNWDRALLLRYASLGQETLSKRLSQAGKWMGSHGDDADLHLALGIMKEANGDRDDAQREYEKSIELQSSREANERLAGLHAFRGDHLSANDYLKAALRA